MKPPGEPVLEMSGITRRFGAVVANEDVSIRLQAGEILALLGENGAGKSTLVSILFGHYVADSGTIRAFGEPLPPGDPAAALRRGIGMVHQHFTLADNLSVLDNVIAGTESMWRLRSARGQARARLLQSAADFGLFVEPDRKVGELSVGERQRVEILKTLYRGARILILDEPTAVLTPSESEALFATLRQLVDKGLSIVFISHKLDEVLSVANRVAVLRAGRLVAELPIADADRQTLATLMVGERVAPVHRDAGSAPSDGEPVCEVVAGTVRAARGARALLHAIDLTVRAGEVFAIAGVSGNGQRTLAEVLFGLRALDDGELRILGQRLPARPAAFVAAGVARIPEDRHADGVVGDLAVWENALLERLNDFHFVRARRFGGLVRRRRAQRHAQVLAERFDVRGLEGAGVGAGTRALSGGNMQKLILGRALSANSVLGEPPEARLEADGPPPLIVAEQPTWGLDIGAVAYVHRRLLEAARAGAGVLLISEDLDEVFALADRVAVMHGGRLSAPRRNEHWSTADIGAAMAGAPAGPTAMARA